MSTLDEIEALPTKKNPRRGATMRWARWIHVYTSMACLLLVLFFGLTGITLNHPSWTFGNTQTTTTAKGTFPFDVVSGDTVDFLNVAEYVRTNDNVKGTVADYSTTGDNGTITFKNPAYEADLNFKLSDNSYTLSVTQSGFIGVMNDLHKGRYSVKSWNWVIDIIAGFLVLISLSGLLMQWFIRKRRNSAFIVATAGVVVTVVLMWLTLR